MATDAPTSPDPAFQRAAGDTAWAATFGATHVAARPFAVAVSGETVVLGGDFIGPMAGMPEGTYRRLAWWDGAGWQRMGDGADAPVHALLFVGDELYVGGELTVVGGTVAAPRLARWDGATWSAVSGGVAHSTQPTLTTVRALASDGVRLFVAGYFDTAGQGSAAVHCNGVAALVLATGEWQALGGGLTFQGTPAEGRALAVHGGRLYVGGAFDTAGDVPASSIAALDLATDSWHTFAHGIRNGDYAGTVDALAVDEGSGAVFVGGSFTSAGAVATSGVATLAGGEFGSLGAFSLYGDQSTARVVALAWSAGRLHAAGHFDVAGNAAVSHWAVHDGHTWSGAGAGVDNTVLALAALGDAVVVAGDFQYSGDLRLAHAGVWTAEGWRTFGQGVSYDPYGDGNVFALAAVDDTVYAAGCFDQAGPVRVGSVAQWTGGSWASLAGGLEDVGVLARVHAMARVGRDLYVTGAFARAGAGTATGIARWDGARWSALGSGIRGTGYALVVLDGMLYVGGSFTGAGDTSANGVARWDPATSTWAALGNAPQFDDAVLSLAVLGDRHLVIGGQYGALRSGTTDLVRGLGAICVFDTHATVDPADPLSGFSFPPGVQRASGPGTVRAMQVLGEEVYVGGTFDTAGVQQLTDPPDRGFPARNLAVWRYATDGGWSSPGDTDEQVQAITTLEGSRLLIGGYFSSAGPVAAAGLVEYDPDAGSWSPFGSGVGPGERGVKRVEALAQSPAHGLWVGGTFLTAGGRPSGSIALWRDTAGQHP